MGRGKKGVVLAEPSHRMPSEYAESLAGDYASLHSKNVKKEIGQFFTPKSIARYMASLSMKRKKELRILDPGAGIGILSLALVENLINDKKVKHIHLDAYEIDKNAISRLIKALENTKSFLNKRKVGFDYKVIEKDFIKINENCLNNNLTNYVNQEKSRYDIIISNPPYKKINKSNLEIQKYQDIVSGQPNLYFLFMAISAKLLSSDGEMIFITPRSFCSGLYYSKFRTWLLKNLNLSHIHLFNSRKELFNSESVLQENIITRYDKSFDEKSILITSSNSNDFNKVSQLKVKKSDVIYRSNGHIFFRIPSTNEELNLVRKLDALPLNLCKMGIKVSTGKVVAFRNREYLLNKKEGNSVPLIWMHNIENMKVTWPMQKKGKPVAILNSDKTKSMLIKSGNYIVLKRFTTKEQKKRFSIGLIYKEDFKHYKFFALDNMVNYIHHPNKEFTKEQVKGIASYLNTPVVDKYFRILNGHTQVNANEVYALPFPSLQNLEILGSSKTKNQVKSKELVLINKLSNIASKKTALAE